MFKVITARQMAVVDRNSEHLGVDRLLLMENAGAAVARAVVEHLGGNAEGKRILTLCGPGNNGGDGMVAARHLASEKAEVTVLLLSPMDKVKTREARQNLEALKNMQLTINLITAVTKEEVQAWSDLFKEADVIVDAVLGTGVRGSLAEHIAEAIKLANESNALRVAVDVPTGVDPDTGMYETAFNSHITVTFHGYKPALVNRPEKIIVADIGIPPEAEVIAGPGHVDALKREIKQEEPTIILIHGEAGPDETLEKTLKNLPCMYVAMHSEFLVTDSATRQAVAKADVVLLDADIQPQEVDPFLARETILILGSPVKYRGKAVHILKSETRQERTREALQRLQTRAKQLAAYLEAPVYVVGEVDAVAYGEVTYLNWLGTPVGEDEMKQATAAAAFLVAKTKNPVDALAAASYLLRESPPHVRQDPKALADVIIKELTVT